LVVFEQSDERPFRPHVTRAHICGNSAAIARKHPIDRDLAFSERVASVELMRSPPAGGGDHTVFTFLHLGAMAPVVGLQEKSN
jgi:2'-5' RNA ligase